MVGSDDGDNAQCANAALISEIVNIFVENGCALTNNATAPCHTPNMGRIDTGSLSRAFDPDTIVKANLDRSFCVRADYKLGRRIKPDISLTPSARFKHLSARFRSGWTIASDGTERTSQSVLELCQMVSEKIGYICQANLYITPEHVRGFPPHFDAHDVLVLHLLGSKIWTIENRPRAVPRRHAVSPIDLILDEDSTSYALNPGDVLFIPKGHAHVVDNSAPGTGAQLTLACSSIHVEDVVLQCISNELGASEIFNRNFPAYPRPGDIELVGKALGFLVEKLRKVEIADVITNVRKAHLDQMDQHAHDSLIAPSNAAILKGD